MLILRTSLQRWLVLFLYFMSDGVEAPWLSDGPEFVEDSPTVWVQVAWGPLQDHRLLSDPFLYKVDIPCDPILYVIYTF